MNGEDIQCTIPVDAVVGHGPVERDLASASECELQAFDLVPSHERNHALGGSPAKSLTWHNPPSSATLDLGRVHCPAACHEHAVLKLNKIRKIGGRCRMRAVGVEIALRHGYGRCSRD